MSKLFIDNVTGANFEYDDTMFEEKNEDDFYYPYLHYIGGKDRKIILPEGCIDCYKMFEDCDLTGCDFSDFDTSQVTGMSYMFYNAKLPENFTLGDKFDTGNVKFMSWMFYNARLPKGFAFGDNFDTSKVTDMCGMFCHTTFPKNFTLGNKFDTGMVEDMSFMFKDVIFPKNFTLGEKFDTSKVKHMGDMFSQSELPQNFSLGDKFDTENVKNMSYMFVYAKIPENFSLGDKFVIKENCDTKYMFHGSNKNQEDFFKKEGKEMNRIEAIKLAREMKAADENRKEQQLDEEIEKLKNQVCALRPRIEELMETRTACKENNIFSSTFLHYMFETDGINHKLGFLGSDIGIEGGGVCNYNLRTNGETIEMDNGDEHGEISKKNAIYVLRRFCNEFDEFESNFYDTVDERVAKIYKTVESFERDEDDLER